MPSRLHPEGAHRLDQLRVGGADAAGGGDVHGEGGGDGDEEDLRGLVDAEPDHEQRDEGEEGDGAQGLEGGVEQFVAEPGESGDDAERESGGEADDQAEAGPGQRGGEGVGQLPVAPQLPHRAEYLRR